MSRADPRIDGRCSWCRDPMPVPKRPQNGGKSKLFCSSACRQAAYRHRKDPERYDDATTWTLKRKGLYATVTSNIDRSGRPEKLLIEALGLVKDEEDAIPTVSAALAALQIEVGELPVDELDDLFEDDERDGDT